MIQLNRSVVWIFVIEQVRLEYHFKK